MKRLLFILLLACCASNAFAANMWTLFYELRVPKTAKFEPLTSFDLVSDSGAQGTRLHMTKKREEGDFVIFADTCLMFGGEKRHAMVVHTDGQAAQVFKMTIPSRPKPIEWTQWQRPDYLETTDAMWTFMHDLKKFDRSTKIPQDSFELRYKIIEYTP